MHPYQIIVWIDLFWQKKRRKSQVRLVLVITIIICPKMAKKKRKKRKRNKETKHKCIFLLISIYEKKMQQTFRVLQLDWWFPFIYSFWLIGIWLFCFNFIQIWTLTLRKLLWIRSGSLLTVNFRASLTELLNIYVFQLNIWSLSSIIDACISFLGTCDDAFRL